MHTKNESVILLFIKFLPPLFIITLSLIVSFTFYLNKQKTYNEEKIEVEKEYIQNNKELVKSQVERAHRYILGKQANIETKLKESIKKRVYEAYDIAINLYNENKHLDDKSIKKLIADALRPIRFNNNRGYFFIYTMDGINILNAAFPKYEGKNFWNYQDSKNIYIIQEMHKILKRKKESFYEWYWNKPNFNKDKKFKKIGFFKKIEALNLFIGTGEYIKDYENDIKKSVLNHIHNLKYSNNEYLFILKHNGVYLNHINKNMIGLNALEVNDIENKQIILDAIEISKNSKGGFLTYIQSRKPGSGLPTKKISYIKGVKKWDWLIGKGFYEDDINEILTKKREILGNRLKENLNSLFIVTLILTVVLLFISFYISKLLEKRFKAYQKEITRQHNILAQQSKMAAIGEMIANIAHQWRQPLSMISAAASGLKIKKEIGVLNDKELEKNLNYINNSTQYLSKTIDDFRNFFAKEQNNKVFSIKESFEEALNIISSQFKNKDIKIVKNINNANIYGIKNEIIQVFINILNNSRDELIKKEKGIKLILIETAINKSTLTISIKDNGKGIKKSNLEHIFEPYFTTKHQSQGTGIGLYMSQEIIVKHFKGTIKMENCHFKYENKAFNGAQTTITLDIYKS